MTTDFLSHAALSRSHQSLLALLVEWRTRQDNEWKCTDE